MGLHLRTTSPILILCHLDLIQQLGVTIQYFEQLDQGQRRLGLAVLIAGEGMVAAEEDFGRLQHGAQANSSQVLKSDPFDKLSAGSGAPSFMAGQMRASRPMAHEGLGIA